MGTGISTNAARAFGGPFIGSASRIYQADMTLDSIKAGTPLGEGGFGSVYPHPKNPTQAIKVPHALESEDHADEMKKVDALRNVNCGQVEASVITLADGKQVVQMEKMENEIDQKFVRLLQSTLGIQTYEEAAVYVTCHIAKQVLCLWEDHKMFYADLKPANTLYKRSDNTIGFDIKLADLGSVSHADQTDYSGIAKTYVCPDKNGHILGEGANEDVLDCILFLIGMYLKELLFNKPYEPAELAVNNAYVTLEEKLKDAVKTSIRQTIKGETKDKEVLKALEELKLRGIEIDVRMMSSQVNRASKLIQEAYETVFRKHLVARLKTEFRNMHTRIVRSTLKGETDLAYLIHPKPKSRPKQFKRRAAWDTLQQKIYRKESGKNRKRKKRPGREASKPAAKHPRTASEPAAKRSAGDQGWLNSLVGTWFKSTTA